MTIKPVEFIGDSLDSLRGFPDNARREAGFQIDKVQHGEEPDDWKPLNTVGQGVKEIRVRSDSGSYRIVYLAKMADAVFVLHCFQKKTRATSQKDIRMARRRYNDLITGQRP